MLSSKNGTSILYNKAQLNAQIALVSHHKRYVNSQLKSKYWFLFGHVNLNPFLLFHSLVFKLLSHPVPPLSPNHTGPDDIGVNSSRYPVNPDLFYLMGK